MEHRVAGVLILIAYIGDDSLKSDGHCRGSHLKIPLKKRTALKPPFRCAAAPQRPTFSYVD
jgi:hypothetical protein